MQFFSKGNFALKNPEKNGERKKHIETLTKIIYTSLAVVALAIGTLGANPAVGDLYEADNFGGTIFKFAAGGTQSTFASALSRPIGFALDAAASETHMSHWLRQIFLVVFACGSEIERFRP